MRKGWRRYGEIDCIYDEVDYIYMVFLRLDHKDGWERNLTLSLLSSQMSSSKGKVRRLLIINGL